MTTTAMREELIHRYSPVIRGQRVDRMPESQVYAIYRSLISRGEVGKKPRKAAKKYRLHEREQFEQLGMDLSFDERFANDQTA